MIVPMKRLFLLCRGKDRDASLARLGAMGAVEVESSVVDAPGIARAAAGEEAAASAAAALREAAAAKSPYELSLRAAPAESSPDPAVRHVLSVAADWTAAKAAEKELDAALARQAPWGDFDPASVREIAAAGIPVSLFSAPAKGRAAEAARAALAGAVSDDPAAFCKVLSSSNGRDFGVLVGASLPEGAAEAGIEEFPLPERAASALRAEREAARARMRMAHGTLKTLAREKPALAAAARDGANRSEWERASANFACDGDLAHLVGWIPASAERNLLNVARSEGWGYFLRDPAPDETPPVLLRTPRLFRPIQALFDMLGILPGYAESDVSVVFYSFFTLFFAMLVGDAGYGLLVLAAWWLARRALRRKAAVSGKAAPRLASDSVALVGVFGAATVVWGVLTGTYFGMPAEWLPAFLSRDLPTARWLGAQANILHLCFFIGFVHLMIARVWNVIQMAPDSRALSQVGWACILYGMYNIVCAIVVDGFAYPAAATVSMVAGVLLVLFFTYKKSELKANVVSLCMTPLNVVSSMGDIISYVRLFAVGLASVKIAETFDTMAAGLPLPLWAKIPCMVLVLLLGHSLNLAMGALSILVHAVRLNTLEFSSAKGITWSGVAYRPFRARRPA